MSFCNCLAGLEFFTLALDVQASQLLERCGLGLLPNQRGAVGSSLQHRVNALLDVCLDGVGFDKLLEQQLVDSDSGLATGMVFQAAHSVAESRYEKSAGYTKFFTDPHPRQG